MLVTEKYPEMMHRGGLGCMIDCINFVPRVHQRPGGVYVTAARDGLILLWDPDFFPKMIPAKSSYNSPLQNVPMVRDTVK